MQGHLSLSGLSISSGMLVNRPGLKVKVGDSRDSSARHDDCSPLHQGALPPARCLDRPAHWVRLAQGCIWATVRMHCWTSAGARDPLPTLQSISSQWPVEVSAVLRWT